jgi:enoyl-CoA hydratase
VGLVTRVVPGTALGQAARELQDRLRALPPLALTAVRDAVRAARELTPREALRLDLRTPRARVHRAVTGSNPHTRWWIDDAVGVIVLDNPPMNVLSDHSRHGIREALAEFREGGARALVLTGAGDRAFCGGADLKEEEELTTETVGKFLQRGDETFRALREYERPIVAAVNGWAMGGGLVLALWCDVRVGSTRAKLGAVGVKVGLMASNVQLSRLLFEGRARDLLLTGRTVEADEAHRVGLLSSVVAPDALMSEALTWARDIAARPPNVVAELKRVINGALDPAVAQGPR